MNVRLLRFALPVICLLTGQLHGQQPAAPAATPAPAYYQVINVIRVTPGKGSEWVKFVGETTKKVAQYRADAGEIVSWTLLRAVMPAGKEAAGDYMISTIYQGVPPEALGGAALEEVWKKAGVTMTTSEASAKRNSLSSLVTTEMWRIRVRLGTAAKGHYIVRNQMKVKDAAGYGDYANSVSKPMAEGWIKDGAMSGWILATKVMPSGTDTAYSAYTVDIYPSWAATFATRSNQAMFEKMVPGKNYQEVMGGASKFRDLANRDLWVVEERVAKSK